MRQREDTADERAPPEIAEDDSAEQCQADGGQQLPLEAVSGFVRLEDGLFDDHGPWWPLRTGCDAQHESGGPTGVFVEVRVVGVLADACDEPKRGIAGAVFLARDSTFFVGIAVRDKTTVVSDDE